MPQVPQALKNLVRLLDTRKQSTGHPTSTSRPCHVLLTSTLSLTPTLRRSICGSDKWPRFSHHLRTLEAHDRLLVLSSLQQTPTYSEGYRSLARLMLQGHFSTVLTTSIDSQLEHALEDALTEHGLPPHAFEVLTVEYDTDEEIAQKLQGQSNHPRIVKLHGSLHEERISATYPDFLELRPLITDSMKRVLNHDILIVGSIEHDHDINKVLTTNSKSNIYYALHRIPPLRDDIIQIIQARKHHTQPFVITGRYGHFDRLFPTLEQLLSANPTNVSPQHVTQKATLVDKHTPPESQEPPPSIEPQMQLSADILLVTVTPIETQAIFDAVQEQHGRTYQRHAPGDKTYYDLGVINGARVCLVESEMGSATSGGSLLTVSEGIQALKPAAVIMVGIAFGFFPGKQRLGDILISRQVRGYEPQRYGSAPDGTPDLRLRGIPVAASKRLVDRFKSGEKDWQGQRVEFGLILSGEKLIDNRALRDQLHALEPEAIGGDMEGVGLSVAATHHNTDWILVKAISDWADGNKSRNKQQRQQKAARNAAQFTLHVLLNTTLIPPANG